ncbi:MAG: hypothetical protein NTU62_13595 [Spirochaetes bacterium]|nr:hypothetical protein [Spirochaetota bacterium]
MTHPTITPAVADTLTDAILLDPAGGSAIITRERFHALMRSTHGLVVLRGRVWELKAERVDAKHVRIRLREER